MGHMLICQIKEKDKEIKRLKINMKLLNEYNTKILNKINLKNREKINNIKEKNQLIELKLKDNIEYTKLISESIQKIKGLNDNSLQDLIKEIQFTIDYVNSLSLEYCFEFRYEISPIIKYTSRLNELEKRSIIETSICKKLNNVNAGELIYQLLKQYL